jgi:hypothetical protein
MEECLRLNVKTHKNLTMGPSFLKPFFALAGTFFRGPFGGKSHQKRKRWCRVQVLLSLSYWPFSEGETYGRQGLLSSLAGARETLTRSNLVGDMKQTDKFVKGQLFNLQRT